MKKIFIIFLTGCIALSVSATSGPLLVAMTPSGGNGYGNIIQYTGGSSSVSAHYDFTGSAGPAGSLVQASDGNLYGMTTTGGANNSGSIIQYIYASNTTILMASLPSYAFPYGSLVQAPNGKLYGLTYSGSAFNSGMIIEYGPGDTSFTVKVNLPSGSRFRGSLVMTTSGDMYGMTPDGGANGGGSIFKYTPGATSYTPMVSLNASASPNGSMIRAANGTLYGMTNSDGTVPNLNNPGYGSGTIFSYVPGAISYTVVYNLPSNSQPNGDLTQAPNGLLYGIAYGGGAYQVGFIFNFDLSDDSFTVIKDFNYADGAYPNGSLTLASDGLLYGMPTQGGANNDGTIISINPTTNAFTQLLDLSGLDGADPAFGHLTEYTPPAGSALSFDGSGEYVNINNNAVGNFGTGDFTVEFDMNTSSAYEYIMAKRSFCGHSNFWDLEVNAGGTITVEFDQDAAATNFVDKAGSILVNDGSWHHVALSRLSGIASLYVDGVLDFDTVMRTSINASTPLTIGTCVCVGQNLVSAYSGQLDELRIWSVSRTQAQIQASMACEVSAQPGLVAAYHFNEGFAGINNSAITTLIDSSRHGYNGTLHNFALSGASSNWVSPGSITNGNACPPVNYWTGASSTNWNDAGNWSVAIPTSTTDALIAGGYSRYPVLTASLYQVHKLTIRSGANINITAPSGLQVYGTWLNQGTANVGDGEVAFNAASADSILGYTSFGTMSIYADVHIGMDAASHADLRYRLFKGTHNIETNGKVTIKSNASGTGHIDEAFGGTLTGAVTMERYISGSAGYHHLSSPVSNATVASWSTSFGISGVNGVQSNTLNQEGTLEQYVENVNTTTSLNNGYYNYTALSNPLTQCAGYSATLKAVPMTLRTFGTPTTGNVSIPVTASAPNPTVRGWNLVGNPYPSSISWTAVKAGNSNTIYGSCYIWHSTGGTTGSWQVYNGTAGTNGVGNVIGSSQGFLIKTTAGTTLSFTNAMRTTDLTTTFYKAPVQLDNEVRIAISSTTDAGSEAVAYTAAGATEGTDIDLDGISPPLPDGIESPSVAFAIGGESYLIHATDAITESTIMPLTIHTGTAGTYYINATSLNVANLPVYLYDNVANTYTDLSTGTVTVTTPGAQEVNGRYSVVFSKKANAMLTDNSVNIYTKTGAIAIERSADGSPAAITVTNLLGQQVINTSTTNSTISLPIATTDAIYIVSVRQNGTETVRKVMVK